MRRRDFIALLAGMVATGPVAARAQEATRVRRIGIFINLPADDPEAKNRLGAFLQGMQDLGWTDGRNMRIDYRWSAGDPSRYRAYATELVALGPDVIVAAGGPIVRIMQEATQTVPIVFVQAIDPVGGGGVASLRRPGSNITGFASIEYRISEKRLQLLKQIAPHVTRVAVIQDPSTPAGVGQFTAAEAVAPSLGVELSSVDVRDAGEMERTVAAFAQGANGSLMVTTTALATIRRDLIISLASQHRLPAVYPTRLFVSSGGLISYGSAVAHQYQLAAGYVDRILKGAKPGDLPVQQATKYEMTINFKTARSLGIEVPRILLASADELID